MSVQAITAALSASCPSPAAKLVLIVLANYANHDLQAWPSLKLLQSETGIKSEASLRTQLQALASCEPPLIRIEPDKRSNGSRASNVYTLLLAVHQLAPAKPGKRPRRVNPVGRKPVGSSVGKPKATPQNLGGAPPIIEGHAPANFGGLEPITNKRGGNTEDGKGFSPERGKPSPAEEEAAKSAARQFTKGKRYPLAGAPSFAAKPAESQQEMAERLRRVLS